MRHKNDKKLKKASTEKELEVVRANLRAWNYWGRIWRSKEKSHPSVTDLELMKSREIMYLKVYLEMASVLGGLKNKTVLDVGCGSSEYHKWSVVCGAKVFGVDISVEMVKLGYDRVKSVEWIVADALHLPFKDGAFDISMTFQALHHFPNWKKALIEMLRTSKAISSFEPNGNSFFHRLMDSIRLIFRVEKRFKQVQEDYKLVEPYASGFSPMVLMRFLEGRGVKCKLFMSGILPASLLRIFYKLSPQLAYSILAVENLIRKIPVLRNQLGGFLLVGLKQINAQK